MEHFELADFDTVSSYSGDTDEIETFEHVFAKMMERIHQQNDELIQRKNAGITSFVSGIAISGKSSLFV